MAVLPHSSSTPPLGLYLFEDFKNLDPKAWALGSGVFYRVFYHEAKLKRLASLQEDYNSCLQDLPGHLYSWNLVSYQPQLGFREVPPETVLRNFQKILPPQGLLPPQVYLLEAHKAVAQGVSPQDLPLEPWSKALNQALHLLPALAAPCGLALQEALEDLEAFQASAAYKTLTTALGEELEYFTSYKDFFLGLKALWEALSMNKLPSTGGWSLSQDLLHPPPNYYLPKDFPWASKRPL